ncbi:hypothetical protein PRK78_007429 [Emydomyces testavorans]|uniref:PLD phosphodiesterase domain-containing protein n=1 Tax=Emydomyces testavorans TaxID=2070801 RepID=A0AAF0DN77_9EURO|nr:hypothetical protein PRK78_007429 [Emydomyces testavorans]
MSESYDEDEALKAALAASLHDARKLHTKSPMTGESVVDLTADSDEPSPPATYLAERAASPSTVDDADLQKAIKLSLLDQASVLTPYRTEEKAEQHHQIAINDSQDSPTKKPSTTTSSGVFARLGIDRKQQEEERLERLARKRKVDEISSTTSPERPAKVKPGSLIDLTSEPAKDSHIVVDKAVSEPNSSGPSFPYLQFPNGAVKKTWAFNCKRENDITFEEVVQKEDLELAVLSSFQWEMDWLFTKFNVKKTRFLLLMGQKIEEMVRDTMADSILDDDFVLIRFQQKEQTERDFADIPTVRLCFVPMAPQVNYLPRKSADSQEQSTTSFFDELVYFLKASTLHDNIIAKLSEFDFSKTENIAFVHTIGGSHGGSAWSWTGVCGLGRAVHMLGLHTQQTLKLDYVTSSVGSLNDQFMRSMYLAAQGDDGLRELTLRTSKTFPSNRWGVTVKQTDGAEWKDNFLVYFPSLKTVEESRARKSGAGTICFQSKWYNQAGFPRHAMRDNLSRREGVLMHSKMLFVRPETGNIVNDAEKTAYRGWAYVGSANLSESAWGRLFLDRSTSKPKLNCRNWECGVIIPIPDDTPNATETTASEARGNDLDQVFGGTVPVPMTVPAPKYGPGNKPWFYLEDYRTV